MARKSNHLGDSHNFGRRVSIRNGRICKPRTVAWEQLMLSASSPLRKLLDSEAERDGLGKHAFAFLPDLRFTPSPDRIGGEVEQVRLRPLGTPSEARRRELAQVVGRSIALWSWFGVSDLHWENLALGADERSRVVFSPLDIEMILADLSMPTETKLIPDADPEYAEVCRHACG
ncbi:MAG TPA: hypothetical protein PLI95_15930, partial [Polyangiaceae bacterium]|nr:hypothetical protein [Polyangiaceae bacterium]